MSQNESPHAGKTVRCGTALDDDGDPAPDDANPGKFPSVCDTELTFEEHGRYVSSLPGSVRDRFQQSALRFDCPECGGVTWVCPVCSDEDDNTPPGWFRGDSTGDQLACHNCNAQEAARQRQEPSFGRGRRGRY